MKPKLFIGSSVEALPIARAIHENLDYDAEVTIWSENIFKLSNNTLDDLVDASEEFDFGIFVFNADDVIEIKSERQSSVRDNVLFELGLFIGKLGKERVYFVMPRNSGNLRLPTDLLGVNPGTYESERQDGNLNSALLPFCNQVRERIKSLHTEKLIDFAYESKKANKLATEKKRFWEYLLTAELLDARLIEINKSIYDMEHGLLFHRNISYDDYNFLPFLSNIASDFGKLLQILSKIFEDELPKAWGDVGTSGNPNQIKNTCDKLISLCREFISWENQLIMAESSEELKPVVIAMQGWSKNIINDILRIPTLLRTIVSNKLNNTSFPAEPIKFEMPKNYIEVIDMINKIFTEKYRQF